MQKGRARIKAYGGSMQEVVKIAFFAELGPDGKVFFKTEGQDGSTAFAISFGYTQEEMVNQIAELARNVLGQQEKQLMSASV
jgi:hypothetical protein